MTLREIICDAGVNTLREYMCIPQGGIGGVETIILPVDSIMVDALSNSHSIRLDDRNISINISTKKYAVDISNDVFIAMGNNDKEVNSGCRE